MEDVQYTETLPLPVEQPPSGVQAESITSEAAMPLEKDAQQEESKSEVNLEPQKVKVEVVIEKKVEVEPEDPIFPDHYYDDGNIPVFKPVILQVELSS